MSARSVFRTVKAAFKSELGKPEKRRNPWPLCWSCHHRVPALCLGCRRCDGCCEKCNQCGKCVLRCPGHKKETRDDNS